MKFQLERRRDVKEPVMRGRTQRCGVSRRRFRLRGVGRFGGVCKYAGSFACLRERVCVFWAARWTRTFCSATGDGTGSQVGFRDDVGRRVYGKTGEGAPASACPNDKLVRGALDGQKYCEGGTAVGRGWKTQSADAADQRGGGECAEGAEGVGCAGCAECAECARLALCRLRGATASRVRGPQTT